MSTLPRDINYTMEELIARRPFGEGNPISDDMLAPTNQLLLGNVQRTATTSGKTATVKAGEDIRPALNSLKSAGGGTLVLLAGVHKVSYVIEGGDKISIVGEGVDQTTIDFSSNNAAILYDTKDNFVIKDLTVTGSAYNDGTNKGGITVRGCSNFIIENVSSDSNTVNGFYISSGYYFTLMNCSADSNSSSGFYFSSENYAVNKDVRYYSVINCNSTNNSFGYRVVTSASYDHVNFNFLNCSALDSTNDGISLEDATNIVNGNIIGFHGNNNSGWTMDIAASRVAIVGCSDSNGSQFLRTNASCVEVSVVACNPVGGYDLSGDIKTAANDINEQPFEAFNLQTTPVGNVGTGQDDLMSYDIPANTLTSVGDSIKVRAWGEVANTANNKSLFLKLNSATLLNYITSFTTSSPDVWVVEATITRTATDTFTYYVKLEESNGSRVESDVGITADDASTITLLFQGTGTADDDIIQNGLIVEIMRALP